MGKIKFLGVFAALVLGWQAVCQAQIDPEKRQLIQFGFNQPLEGHGPLAAYAFYYRNDPGFIRTNITLRLAVAPIYLDSELGFKNALGENTDLGIGFAGGGFADSYFEVRGGKLFKEESFTGHGAEVSASIYHLFNPSQRIPLNWVMRLTGHYSVYEKDDQTGPGFVLPDDRATVGIRTGLRWGGKEPTLSPDLAMEISTWYEGQARTGSGSYGYLGDRDIRETTHLFWARALLAYTIPDWQHKFSVSLTAGSSVHADRFSAYRLGGLLPLSSEFPLIIPGYYYQELTAKQFALLSAQYLIPIDNKARWNITMMGSAAEIEYLQGVSQPGHFHSGLGAGLGYRSPSDSWEFLLGYGYGFDAIRSGGRGSQSLGVLAQFNLEARHHRDPLLDVEGPAKSRGLFHFLGL
ncbi:MAG: hypothetical protein JWM04_548 [Verrucomicrobiales bacterium]|nr:hypothetical protein [Verrucomicrobiales bacterium]